MQYFLSICITSYKRVKELQRCLESIDTKRTDIVEIVVSEDCSPQREAISKMVSRFSNNSPFHVVFNSNKQNLGYDRNLKKLATLAQGEYIIFMSDDDCFFPEKLDTFIQCLEEEKPAMAYASFWYGYEEEKQARRKYPSSHKIAKGEASISRRVYDAILFSGLTFRREHIINIEAEPFKNMNYFQVYMFLTVMYHFGGYYQDNLLIDSVSDGENAYGQVSSSGKGNQLMADRENVFSNIEFNKGLFKVIKQFDTENGTQVFSQFCKEYSLRSFGGFCRARQHGIQTYKDYWQRLKTSGAILSPICMFYYIVVGLLGASLSRKVFGIPKKILLVIRRHN